MNVKKIYTLTGFNTYKNGSYNYNKCTIYNFSNSQVLFDHPTGIEADKPSSEETSTPSASQIRKAFENGNFFSNAPFLTVQHSVGSWRKTSQLHFWAIYIFKIGDDFFLSLNLLINLFTCQPFLNSLKSLYPRGIQSVSHLSNQRTTS